MRRRFIAFLTLIVSTIVILLGSFASVYTNTRGGIEFENGKQYVYKISSNDEDGAPVDIEDAASEMNRRLKSANVNYFDITTEGEDQIRVTFTGVNSSEEEHIKQLLSYNALFTLATTDDEQTATGDEIFKDSVARIEYKNEYPIIIIPISDSTKAEIIREHATTISKSDESSSDTSIDYTMIVLWANKTEGDDFENAMNPDNPDYLKMQEKVLLAFASSEDNFYYNGNHNELCYVVNVSSSSDSTATAADVRNAAIEAQHKVNLFNAGSLDYNVEFLYELNADAYVEELIKSGDNLFINWNSKVLISAIAAFALITILLVAYYRISSPVAIVTVLASMLLNLFVFNAFGVEFSIGAVLGLVVTALLGLFSNIFYFEKLKNELYKGRTLKKANQEASKRSTLPIIDASVVVLLASLITYFVSEPMIRPFAVMASTGAACNLLLVLLGGKLLMWLLTNDSYLQSHKKAFGVDEEKIPNTANEEKQSYFGPYDGKDFTKKSPRVGIIAGILAIIGVTCTLAFNFTIGTFRYESTTEATRIQLVVDERSEIKDVETLDADLKELGFKTTELISAKEVDPNDENITLKYYVVVIKSFPSEDSAIFTTEPVYDDSGKLDKYATTQSYLEKKYQAIDSDAEVKVLEVNSATRVLNVWKVALAVLFGILLSALYLVLRYGFAKAISSISISILSTFLSLAFFIIFRITFNDMAGLALLGIMNVSLLSSIFLYAKDKEMMQEKKEESNKEVLVKSVASAFNPMAIFHSMSILVFVLFIAFGPSNYEICFTLLALGSLISLFMNTTLLGPTYYAIRESYANSKARRQARDASHPKKDKKKKKKTVQKTNEPEESIFIGIND